MPQEQNTPTGEKIKPPATTRGFNITFDPQKVKNTILYSDSAKSQERKAKLEQKYRDALNNLPNRGGGLHGALQSVCNLGIIAGIAENILYDEITATGKAFKPHEVEDAINKAVKDSKSGYRPNIFARHPESRGEKVSKILDADKERSERLQAALIHAGGDEIDPFGADVWEASNPHPQSFPHSGGMDGSECCSDMLLFLSELYNPGDLLYLGTGYEKTEQQPDHIKTADEWRQFFTGELNAIREEENEREQYWRIKAIGNRFPYFIVNPLDGKPNNNGSFRSDANVSVFRYILLESDSLPIEQQIPLLAGLKLPVVSMTFSGSKSIHALIDAASLNGGREIETVYEYKTITKNLFGQLSPLGFDKANSNPSRLSRLPGAWREETNKFQKLVYVNKKGGVLWLTK